MKPSFVLVPQASAGRLETDAQETSWQVQMVQAELQAQLRLLLSPVLQLYLLRCLVGKKARPNMNMDTKEFGG